MWVWLPALRAGSRSSLIGGDLLCRRCAARIDIRTSSHVHLARWRGYGKRERGGEGSSCGWGFLSLIF